MDGVLLIDKPSGPTSFDVVRVARKSFGQRKAGHAGTLDPLASGLLAVCLGRATRLVPYLMDGEKRYLATVALGSSTDTDDSEGETIEDAPVPDLSVDDITACCDRFVGAISQIPPVYSAIKRDGEALYKKARRGDDVRPEPRIVVVHSIDVRSVGGGEIELDIVCGKGTYIRSIARDLAEALGTKGHLSSLKRTSSSGFGVGDAIPLDRLKTGPAPFEAIVSMADAIAWMPTTRVGENDLTLIADGRPIPRDDATDLDADNDAAVRILSPDGSLAAIGRVDGDRIVMERVFAAKG